MYSIGHGFRYHWILHRWMNYVDTIDSLLWRIISISCRAPKQIVNKKIYFHFVQFLCHFFFFRSFIYKTFLVVCFELNKVNTTFCCCCMWLFTFFVFFSIFLFLFFMFLHLFLFLSPISSRVWLSLRKYSAW